MGCINQENKDVNKNEEDIICRYWYQVKINSTFCSYDINVPIPVYYDENKNIQISQIMENLKVSKGSASFNVENTSFGPSLKINGSDNVIIEVEGEDPSKFLIKNKYEIIFLSLVIDEDNDGYIDDEYALVKYHIYCYQNITLNISINFHYRIYKPSYSKTIIDIDSDIYQKWNIVNGTFYTAV